MATCSRCPGRTFKSIGALHQHKIDAKGHPYCVSCMMDFGALGPLLEVSEVHYSPVCRGDARSPLSMTNHRFGCCAISPYNV